MAFLDILIGNKTINLICLCVVAFIILYNFFSLYKYNSKSGTNFFILWLVITLYSVFYSPEIGDNFSSLETYYKYQQGINEDFLHFEPIYFRFMDIATGGYVSWRFLIWGIGSLLLILLLKWRKFDCKASTIAILYFTLPLIYYQRAIIGYVLLYFALSLLIDIQEQKLTFASRLRNVLFVIICIILSLQMHTTMVFYAFLMLIAAFLPPKRGYIIIFFTIGVICSLFFNDIASTFLSHTSEETQITAERYLESGKQSQASNVFGIIVLIISNGPLYLLLFYSLFNINSAKLSFNRFEQAALINVCMLLFVGAIYANISSEIQGKFIKASYMPLGLFLSSYYTHCKNNRIAFLFAKVSFICFVLLLLVSIITGGFAEKL